MIPLIPFKGVPHNPVESTKKFLKPSYGSFAPRVQIHESRLTKAMRSGRASLLLSVATMLKLPSASPKWSVQYYTRFQSRSGIGRVVAVSVVLAVVAIAAVSSLFLLSSSPSPSNGSASEPSITTCASATPVANYRFLSPPPNKQVLLLQPGKTVEVCVTYTTEWNSTSFQTYKSSFFDNGTLTIPVQILNDVPIQSNYSDQTPSGSGSNSTSAASSTTVTYTTGTAYHAKAYTGSFDTAVLPSSITPTPTVSSFTILYTITPLSNSTGFYSEFDPAPGLLLAVGYTASQVQASDFPAAGLVHGTFASPYTASSVSVIGGTVVDLTISGR